MAGRRMLRKLADKADRKTFKETEEKIKKRVAIGEKGGKMRIKARESEGEISRD